MSLQHHFRVSFTRHTTLLCTNSRTGAWAVALTLRTLLLLLLLDRLCLPSHCEIISILDCDTLGHMVDFVDTNQSFSEFEHVVPQTDDNKLCILGAFLDVARYN
jgi:hypothetical protein